MKSMSSIARKELEGLYQNKPQLCHFITENQGIVALKSPILSSEHTCQWCGGSNCYTPLVDPSRSKEKTWLCSNPDCFVYTRRSCIKTSVYVPKRLNALEWPVFCDLNGIGDVHHDIKFEKVQQSSQKISYMLKFVENPQGIIFMEGETGTGKSYAAMAICELFIRKDNSAIFTTEKQLFDEWVKSYTNTSGVNLQRFNTCTLLVIDDFCITEPTEKYLKFIMELINQRLQWKRKGTVITTNMNWKRISEIFGDAFTDRLKTGQRFEFKDKSRRKPTIL